MSDLMREFISRELLQYAGVLMMLAVAVAGVYLIAVLYELAALLVLNATSSYLKMKSTNIKRRAGSDDGV